MSRDDLLNINYKIMNDVVGKMVNTRQIHLDYRIAILWMPWPRRPSS